MISALLLTLGVAHANIRDLDVCVTVDTAYSQRVTLGDYWADNDTRPLRGVKIRVMGPGVDETQFAEDFGSRAGCAEFTLDSDDTYSVLVISEAQVDGRQLASYERYGVWNNRQTVAYSFYPLNPPSGTSPFTYTIPVPYDTTWGTLLAGGYALYRHDFDVSLSYLFKFDTSDCCVRTGSWIKAGTNRLRTILHEFGHGVGHARDESASPNKSYSASQGSCTGWPSIAQSSHAQNSREYESAAAVEGFADFVAAVTLNSRGQSDCHYRKSSSGDWDLDTFTDGTSNDQISCEGVATDLNHNGSTTDPGENFVQTWLTAKHWLEKTKANTSACAGTPSRRAARHDWLRFFWDMTTDEGVHPDNVATLWDTANPKNWKSGDGSAGHADMPSARLLSACSSMGLYTECLDQWSNGLTGP